MQGHVGGVTTAKMRCIDELECEYRKLRCTNKILRTVSAFFHTGGARPQTEVVNACIDQHRDAHEVELICKVLQASPRPTSVMPPPARQPTAARCPGQTR